MRSMSTFLNFVAVALLGSLLSAAAASNPVSNIQVGLRPYYLVQDMDDGVLKKKLDSCREKKLTATDFSIGHRGAPLQFPEHTLESYLAAARMGAGIVECDVTFTKDKELVCRHSQCDLHTTTNIVATDLGRKCSVPFQPADFSTDGTLKSPASARCCTSDLTLAEFKTLRGKVDVSDRNATTAQGYLRAPTGKANTLFNQYGTLLSHRESIVLLDRLNVKMTPELKAAEVTMPFAGFSQKDYARKMLHEYEAANVDPSRVYPQSFNLNDVLFWQSEKPEFAAQAVFLDGRETLPNFDFRKPLALHPSMAELVEKGVKIIAPPMWMLLDIQDGEVVPSAYAKAARAAGLDIIAWSIERSGSLSSGGGYYYQSVNGLNQNSKKPESGVIDNDGDVFTVLHVLARDVSVIGVFSDWPGTVTYYANCMDL